MVSVDLKLDNDEDHPRRFLRIGEHLIAYGGDDGKISRISHDDTVKTIRCVDEDAVRAVGASSDGKRVVVGLDSGATLVYVYDDYDASNTTEAHPFVQIQESSHDNLMSQSDAQQRPQEVVWSGPTFSGPLRDLVFFNRYYCAMACETGFCVVNLQSKETMNEHRYLDDLCQRHHDQNGIRSIDWATIGDRTILASLAMDGRLCLWDTTSETPADWSLLLREDTKAITKKDPGEILGADSWDRSCRPLFSASKLFLPGESYVQMRTFGETVESFHQPFDSGKGHADTIVALAGRGDYLMTTGRDGRVCLWKVPSNEVEFVSELGIFDSAPTDLMWFTPDKCYIACANGSMEVLQGLSVNAPVATQPQVKPSETVSRTKDDASAEDSDDDVDFEKGGSRPTNQFVDDEADDGESTNTKPDESDENSGTDSVVNDDVSSTRGDDYDMLNTASFRPGRAMQLDLPEPQAAFAPSSTPLDLARRFMCWNHIGSITYMQGEFSRNTVDVSFTDSAFRRPISFTDNMGFILASLGEDGAFFATDLVDNEEEDDNANGDVVEGMSDRIKELVKKSQRSRMSGKGNNGSTLYFNRFETFGPIRDKDWYLSLPSGERALGCATGEGWAAAATSRRLLRLFTSGGNQGQVVWLPGDPVTMAGRGRYLAVVYHESMPLLDGTQQLGYMVYDMQSYQLVSKGPLSCISKASSLSWVGFSNDGSLCTMDSDGMVSMLVCSNETATAWEWMPMLDTVGLRKSMDDGHWPVTVFDGKLVCVPLKGGTKHPDATRKPVTATLSMRLPFAKGSVPGILPLEELSVRADVALRQKKAMQLVEVGDGDDEEFNREYRTLSAQVDKVTLKMFAATVEAGKLERALDLVHRFHLEKSYDLAMTIADAHRRLVDMIDDAKERRFGAEDSFSDTEEPLQSSSSITPDGNDSRKAKRSFGDLSGEGLPNAQRVRRAPIV